MTTGAFDKPLADAIMRHALDVTRVEASLRIKVMRRMLRLQKELVTLVQTERPSTKATTDALVARAGKAIGNAYIDIHELLQPALTSIAKTQATVIVKAINRA